MKRIITAILAAALAASVCVFAGCGEGAQSSATEPATEAVTEAPKLEELQLSRGTFMKYDPNVVTVEGYDVSANDGSWTLSIHECYDADNLAKRKEYYDKAVNDEGHTDVVTAEKQLGAYAVGNYLLLRTLYDEAYPLRALPLGQIRYGSAPEKYPAGRDALRRYFFFYESEKRAFTAARRSADRDERSAFDGDRDVR